MKKLFLVSLLIAAVCTPSSARDIYVYNGVTPVKTVKDVRKISFATGVMNLTQEDGTVNAISLSDFNNFSFKSKSGNTTGINDVYAGSKSSRKVSKAMENGKIVITAGDKKYNVAGQRVK